MISGCATLNQLLEKMDVKKPVVRVNQVNLTALSFEDATLRFRLEIQNPNNIGVTLDGFDYRLDIDQHAFLNGDQTEKTEIAAGKSSFVDVPVTVNFTQLFDTIKDLVSRNEVAYQTEFGLKFNLPVLGMTRIPVSHAGTLPLPKLPDISLSSLKVSKMGLTGADLLLVLKIDNPNIFGFDLTNLDYNLSVDGNRWAQGRAAKIGEISAGNQSVLNLPIALNFIELGRSVYNLINSGHNLNYHLTGKLDINGKGLPLQLQGAGFDRSGKIDLEK
jgi:LEA14-like dessication related protein